MHLLQIFSYRRSANRCSAPMYARAPGLLEICSADRKITAPRKESAEWLAVPRQSPEAEMCAALVQCRAVMIVGEIVEGHRFCC